MEWLASRFELYRGAANNERPIEGLRGFAVFLVFLVHYTAVVWPWIPPQSALESLSLHVGIVGRSGVDLFFVLSGYLIYGSLISRATPFVPFMRRRIQRLYPTFATVFVLYVALSVLIPSESKLPHGAWPALRYLVANALLLPRFVHGPPMITVAWSLTYEMFFYVVSPALILVLGLRVRSVEARIAFFVGLTALFVAYCALFGGPIRLVGFAGGIILFEILHSRLLPAPGTFVGTCCLVGGLVLMLVPTPESAAYAVKILLLVTALSVLCFACLGRPASGLATFFSWTPMRWLGNMSYSYYLLHGVSLLGFFRLLVRVWPPSQPSWLLSVGLLPIAFAFTLVTASILFLLVEKPFSLKPTIRRVSSALDSKQPLGPRLSPDHSGN